MVQKGTEGEPGGQDDGTLRGPEGGVWNVLLGPFRSFLSLGDPAPGQDGEEPGSATTVGGGGDLNASPQSLTHFHM